ncbi:MAG: serine/threonine-protein kinase [Gordonia sp. (in: high G+C Gram-positive bacteria)]
MTIGGYRIIDLLGSGGMGDVYVVENEHLRRREAMKVISFAGASNPEFQQRFAIEARTLAALDHPSIITIHNNGVDNDRPWFTMNLIDGPSLAAAVLTPAEVVNAIGQIADGLDYAHQHDVIHRDVKAANITLAGEGSDFRAVLLDFGLAKLADSPRLTAMNAVVGTSAFTAPEVISGLPATAASDQYSLACTTYEVLTGTVPFPADNPASMMLAHVHQPVPNLGFLRPDLAALGPVLARAMAKYPADRFPSCRAFTDECQRALNLGAVAPAAPSPGIGWAPPGQLPQVPTPAPPTSTATTLGWIMVWLAVSVMVVVAVTAPLWWP